MVDELTVRLAALLAVAPDLEIAQICYWALEEVELGAKTIGRGSFLTETLARVALERIGAALRAAEVAEGERLV